MPPVDRPSSHTLTKAELVERVRESLGLGWQESADLLDAAVEIVKETLEAGESIKISGFGTFEVKRKRPWTGRNPQTAERIWIRERTVLNFRPSLVFRHELNRALREG